MAADGIDPPRYGPWCTRENRIELLVLLFGARQRVAPIAPISRRLPSETVTTLCSRIDPEFVLNEPCVEGQLEADVQTRTFSRFLDPHSVRVPEADSDVARLFLYTDRTTGVPRVLPPTGRQLEWNAITVLV